MPDREAVAAVSGSPRPVGVPGWLRRPAVAGLVLLAVYVGVSFLNASTGYLGTDTGGKTATLKVMAERGDFDPDLGYWARAWDPDATVHGLFFTSRIGDRYINVTSLPMVLAARPLWSLGGYRAALLLPMAGAVAAAFAARAIARRVADGAGSSGSRRARSNRPGRTWDVETTGWAAFWVIGLASPLAIYALDLWEHAIGVGLIGWAVVLLLDAVSRRPTWWRGLTAGAAFGLAASMRTEAFVYVVTSVGIACLALVLWRRAWWGALEVGGSAVVGFVGLFLANTALEKSVLGDGVRGARAGGAASGGLSDLTLRFREGLVTSFSAFPSVDVSAIVIGLVLFGALAYLAVAVDRRREQTVVRVLCAVVVIVYVLRFADGLGFVPGLVAASPLAAVGVALGWRRRRDDEDGRVDATGPPTGVGSRRLARLVLLAGVVPLPLVFAFQFVGGAAPQWAGRYILPSCLLLTTLGVVRLGELPRWARTAGIGLSAVVTVFGLAWLYQRSHDVAAAADRLEARPEPVLISPNGFVPREFGGTYGRKNWLAATPATFDKAVGVVGAAGIDRFAVVDLDTASPPRTIPGFRVVSSERQPFLPGADFLVTSYERNR